MPSAFFVKLPTNDTKIRSCFMFWVSKHEQVFAMDDVWIKRTGIVITNVEYISSFNNRPTQNDYFYRMRAIDNP